MIILYVYTDKKIHYDYSLTKKTKNPKRKKNQTFSQIGIVGVYYAHEYESQMKKKFNF